MDCCSNYFYRYKVMIYSLLSTVLVPQNISSYYVFRKVVGTVQNGFIKDGKFDSLTQPSLQS